MAFTSWVSFLFVATASIVAASSTTSTASSPTPSASPQKASGGAQASKSLTLLQFFVALTSGLIVFALQILLFLALRNKLARIFKPKTFLVPDRERTPSPPSSVFGLLRALFRHRDREIINKCGLDAYFFDRYLKTLLVVFIPITAVVVPILIPINYIGGLGQSVVHINSTSVIAAKNGTVIGLDTLSWGNISPENTSRYWAHLIIAVCVVIWVCIIFFMEMRIYIKVRQDYLTSAEHRLRASATTVMVNNVPTKWVTEEALRGLFDVFPGGIRNVWLTRDLTRLLAKIQDRDNIHQRLEQAETGLIREAKKKQLKRKAAEEKLRRRQLSLAAETKEEKTQRMHQEDLNAQRVAEGEPIPSGNEEGAPQAAKESVGGSENLTLEFTISRSPGNHTSNLPKHNLNDDQAHHSDRQAGGRQPGDDSYGEDKVDDSGPLSILKALRVPKLTEPVVKVRQGLRSGFEKAGQGFRDLESDAQTALIPSGGYAAMPKSNVPTATTTGRRVQISETGDRDVSDSRPTTAAGPQANPLSGQRIQSESEASRDSSSTNPYLKRVDTRSVPPVGNTVRKVDELANWYIEGETKFWEFWKPPTGAFASPIPQEIENGDDYPLKKNGDVEDDDDSRSIWSKAWDAMPWASGPEPKYDYPAHINEEYKEDQETPAEWERWLDRKDRPTHRLPILTVLPSLPLIGKQVDTIYWCRGELARLNLEIKEDQQHPERYPVMNSAFIQFNQQVSAHMACQSLIHHIPKKMTPREIEVSPGDVIWDNMALSWWQRWIRSSLIIGIILAMVVFWAIPIGWTAALSQIDTLTRTLPWLSWVNDSQAMRGVAIAIAGVLPTIVLSLLLYVVPLIFYYLADLSGVKTGTEKEEFVQVFYFIFLFMQVFLVVSITSFFAASVDELFKNIQAIQTIQNVLDILAQNLPAAANYFFSYMVLQALSTSSGTLLQVGALLAWFLIGRLFDTTARDKWNRNVQLSQIQWGSFFPIYTNFACIALIYCVVAPLISIFALITFGLLWVAQRYSIIYVTRFQKDTGGVLYPRAINQTFTGLYVMQLCLIGLFSIARDQHGNSACPTQATIMAVVLVLTAGYQILLNKSFASLFRYLPITYEDEAVLRDKAFEHAQDMRLGLLEARDDDDKDGDKNGDQDCDDDNDGDMDGDNDGDVLVVEGGSERQCQERSRSPLAESEGDVGGSKPGHSGQSIELTTMQRVRRQAALRNRVKAVGAWAMRSSRQKARPHQQGKQQATPGGLAAITARTAQAARYRAQRRERDVEAQQAMGEALYGGIHDDIEDLTPEERDALVRHAFQHSALRARRPAVWLPRDDLGVSDDEVARTRNFSDHIWVANDGTALDSKVRVVFGHGPPDFSQEDLISL